MPYWRLEGASRIQAEQLAPMRRLAMAVRPVLDILRRAAPTAAIVVVTTQLLSGVATAWALLLTTQVLGQLLGNGAGPERLRAALPGLLVLGVVLMVRMALDAGMMSARAQLVPKVHRLAQEDLFRVSLQVELASFDDAAFYDQLHRARDRGVMHLEGATGSLVEAISAVFAFAGAAAALLWLNPLLLAILLLALLPEGWAAINAARMQYAGMATSIALVRQTEMITGLATDRDSAPELRANQVEDYMLAEFARCSTDLQRHQVALGLAEARTTTLGRVLSGLGLVGTFVALGLLVHAQWLGLAVAGTAVIAIQSASASVVRLLQVTHELFEKGLYISDYVEFLERSKQRCNQHRTIPAPANPGRIELDQVSFRYAGGDGHRAALRGISLAIEAGQTIALVGENGSGKTTLAKLIAGLYQPSSGRISWDGVDLQDMEPESRADRVVMVQQNPIRWPRSARDNVRLGRHARVDPDAAALLEAARQSRAREVIDGLPDGWDTLLSPEFRGGRDLSAGQWQRLAVARGLYRDAPLVIWDEPTAPLDAKAEHAVYESLRTLSRNKTVILITHRLASIRNADRIFYLERGVLLEQGRHEELLQMDGRYAELYRLQTQLHGLDGKDA
ncbi:MAG TPA: ABC transporter ATP-binding protein [Xanthomonadaceae bacterium]|jgi:ATP-binding cassette subfamily B protein